MSLGHKQRIDDDEKRGAPSLARIGLVLGLVLCTGAACTIPKLGTVVAEHGEGCQGSGIHNVKCAANLSCLVYDTPAVDSGYGGAFCEIPCTSTPDCPAGYQCSQVADGPWQVCTQSTTQDVVLYADAIVLNLSVPGVTVDPVDGTMIVLDDTNYYESNAEPAQCVYEGNDDAADAIYEFEAPATGVYEFHLDPSVTKFDAVLYLSTTYPVTPATCTAFDDDGLPVLGNDKVNMLLHQGEKILVIVDGKKPIEMLPDYKTSGSFKLVISLD